MIDETGAKSKGQSDTTKINIGEQVLDTVSTLIGFTNDDISTNNIEEKGDEKPNAIKSTANQNEEIGGNDGLVEIQTNENTFTKDQKLTTENIIENNGKKIIDSFELSNQQNDQINNNITNKIDDSSSSSSEYGEYDTENEPKENLTAISADITNSLLVPHSQNLNSNGRKGIHSKDSILSFQKNPENKDDDNIKVEDDQIQIIAENNISITNDNEYEEEEEMDEGIETSQNVENSPNVENNQQKQNIEIKIEQKEIITISTNDVEEEEELQEDEKQFEEEEEVVEQKENEKQQNNEQRDHINMQFQQLQQRIQQNMNRLSNENQSMNTANQPEVTKVTPFFTDLPKDPNIPKEKASNSNNLLQQYQPKKDINNTNTNNEFVHQNMNSSAYSSSYYDEENEFDDQNNNNNYKDNNNNNNNNYNHLNPIYIHPKIYDEDDGVPPALRPLVFHAKDSFTYQALQGEQLHGLTQTALTSIVNDLRKYVDLAVDHNLINEACHVQQCIDNLRNDHSAEKMQVDREISDIDRRLQEANLELEERLAFWRNQEYTVNKEFEMQVSDLQINREQSLSDLDNEWQSPKRQQSYSKPSSALLNLRHMAKKMIRTQQFEEVKKLARLIEAKEKNEIEDAAKRMNEDYRIADQRLNEQFEHEQKVIESMHEMKLHHIIRSRDQSLRPLYQRIENLQKMKEQATKVQKKTSQLVIATTPRKRAAAGSAANATARSNTKKNSSRDERTWNGGNKRTERGGNSQQSNFGKNYQTQQQNEKLMAQKQLPALLVTPKLALPPVQRIKRDGTKSQMGGIAPPNSTNGGGTSSGIGSNNGAASSSNVTICRPKTLSRLSNPSDKNSSVSGSRKNNANSQYH